MQTKPLRALFAHPESACAPRSSQANSDTPATAEEQTDKPDAEQREGLRFGDIELETIDAAVGTVSSRIAGLLMRGEAIDLADPEKNEDNVCFHVDARSAFKSAVDGMWVDLFREKEKGPGHYTFWDYFPHTFRHNKGWRIDHILGTRPMAERLKKIWIDKEPRTREKPSDHTFLVAEFSA
jgi:hypothetical protein